MTPPESSLPGPSVTVGFPPMLAAYPSTCGEFEQGFPYGYGPARVGLDLPPTTLGLVAPFAKTKPSTPAAHTGGGVPKGGR